MRLESNLLPPETTYTKRGLSKSKETCIDRRMVSTASDPGAQMLVKRDLHTSKETYEHQKRRL